jgi:hypothetical protein
VPVAEGFSFQFISQLVQPVKVDPGLEAKRVRPCLNCPISVGSNRRVNQSLPKYAIDNLFEG